MESINERHVTDTIKLMNLVRTTETLVTLGRPLAVALHDVANANGLTKADVAAMVKLVNINK